MAIWFLSPIEGLCCECRPNVCDPCCDCAPATLVQRSVTASLSKCGFDEWPGFVSTPPKKYLEKTLSGVIHQTSFVSSNAGACGICIADAFDTYSGACTYTAPSCNFSNSGNWNENAAPDCINYSVINFSTCAIVGYDSGQVTINYSSSTKTVTGNNSCIAQTITNGTAQEALSSEYTSAQLKTYTEAALPSYSGAFTPNVAFGFGVFDTDETSYFARQSEYKFVIPAANISGCNSYQIIWDHTIFPTSGGSSILSAFNYVWDGISSNSPTYVVGDILPVPGEVVVSNVNYVCT